MSTSHTSNNSTDDRRQARSAQRYGNVNNIPTTNNNRTDSINHRTIIMLLLT